MGGKGGGRTTRRGNSSSRRSRRSACRSLWGRSGRRSCSRARGSCRPGSCRWRSGHCCAGEGLVYMVPVCVSFARASGRAYLDDPHLRFTVLISCFPNIRVGKNSPTPRTTTIPKPRAHTTLILPRSNRLLATRSIRTHRNRFRYQTPQKSASSHPSHPPHAQNVPTSTQ